MTETAAPPRTTYRSVFASPGYAALFAANALSMIAASLLVLAFSVSVYDQTRSPLWSSVAFAAGFLPQVVGGLLLPSLADRVPARVLLPVGGLVRAVAAALLATGLLGVGGGIAVVAAASAVQPLFSAAQSALVSRLLTGDRYVLGRSLFTITSMVSQLLGLALGGATLQTLGPGPALWTAAGMQVLAGLVFLVGLPALPVVREVVERWHPLETLRGYGAVLRVPLLRRLLLLWWTPLPLFVGAESLAVAYAGALGADGVTTALLLAASPAGAFAGEIVVGRFVGPAARERWVLPMVVLLGVALLPLALTPPPFVAVALVAVSAFGLAYALGGQAEFRDALPPGRESVGFGLLGVGMMTGQGVGPLLAGPLGAALGAGPAMAACGLLALGGGAALAVVAQRTLSRARGATPVGQGPSR